MCRILMVDDDLHTPLIAISGYAFSAPETDDPACFRMALSLGAA